MTRHLVAALALGLTLAAGLALGSIGRQHAAAPQPQPEAEILAALQHATVVVPLHADDLTQAERHLFPAPATALGLADSLELDPEQRQQLRQLLLDLDAEALALGRRLVAEERRLERAFAENNIEAARVDALTARIAALQGRLRALRLRGHLTAHDLLRPDQLLRFATLRGYEPAASDGFDDLDR